MKLSNFRNSGKAFLLAGFLSLCISICSQVQAENTSRIVPPIPDAFSEETPFEYMFITIDQGQMSGIRQPLEILVSSEKEWHRLWAEHASAFLSKPEPYVDFSKDMVVGVFAGQKPSGGYEIEITAIKAEKDRLTVNYRETAPLPGEVVTAALTQPFHIVKIEKWKARIDFNKTQPKEGHE